MLYQDFIHHSLGMLACVLPETAHFSETSLENLPKVMSLLITLKNFLVYTFFVFFFVILHIIQDTDGLIV